MRFVLIGLIALGGCCFTKKTDNSPIVSPTTVSTEEQGANAPVFPNYIPWWR